MREREYTRSSEQTERGYPLFFFHTSHQWKLSWLVSSVILATSVGFFVWCTHVSNDLGGDSFAGLVFAVGATVFMILAAVGFTLKRQARQRTVGELNTSLNWHVCFGVIALIMVFLHAFGNYNPRSGTYALYAMIALVICGIIGRMLDRMLPRMIAQRARKTLTTQGEDRIESITQKLQSIAVHKKQEQRTFQSSQRRSTYPTSMPGAPTSKSILPGFEQDSWDMAFLSLDETSQLLGRGNTGQYRFASNQKNTLIRSNALYPGAEDHLNTIKEEQQALSQEAFFRYVIRMWRVVHITLAIVTVGLTLWHVEYALSLVIPALQKFGFGYLLPWP